MAQDDQQIADQRRLFVSVQGHNLLFVQFAQGHFHHADRTVNDFLPRCDDRFRLLTLQHHARDFRRICQMSQPGFVDDNACLRQSILQFVFQCDADFVHSTPQCDFMDFAMVVGKAVGQVTQRCFTLNRHVIVIVIDIKRRLGGVRDVPDRHRRNFNGISRLVVDLEFRPLEIARP